jgi:DNA-binding CsgD family transcriptional regulator
VLSRILAGLVRAISEIEIVLNTNGQISDLLSIIVKTVESHRAAGTRKLNLSSTAVLMRYAVRNKFGEP